MSAMTVNPELKTKQLVVQVTPTTRGYLDLLRDLHERRDGTRPSEADIVRRMIFRSLPEFFSEFGMKYDNL